MGLAWLIRIILALALPPGINAKMVNNRRKEGAHIPIFRFEVLQKLDLRRWFVKCRLALSELCYDLPIQLIVDLVRK